MEDNLKILKVKYLSNHLLNPTPILNLSLNDQSVFYTLEDDLKILKVEYLSNCLLDQT